MSARSCRALCGFCHYAILLFVRKGTDLTDRLYYRDSFLREFDAQVVSCDREGDRLRVMLDKTAFYPTSGGQPHDLGRLGDVAGSGSSGCGRGAVAASNTTSFTTPLLRFRPGPSTASGLAAPH